MRSYPKPAFSLVFLLSIFLAACGGPTQIPTANPTIAPSQPTAGATEESMGGGMGQLPSVDPTTLSGQVVTAGSSTVFPLSERMAERFEDEGFQGNVTVDSIGSGAGFERFCAAGETDISNASRPITDSEVEACGEIGRGPIEFRVGTDALAVAVSTDNNFVENVTLQQLAMIFSSAETWSDVDASWPEEPIQRFIPGTDSGTFDYFVEAIFDENEAPILAPAGRVPQLSEDDNVLVQGVTGSPHAIGFFGYAYYQENQGKLRILSIEAVEATAEKVDAGEYPLARPLFIYSDAGIMQAKPQVAGFINFYLTHVNEEVTDVGYFPATEQALLQAKQNWLEAMNPQG